MKGSFSIEAALIVPVTIMIMIFAIENGIALYGETKEQAERFEQQETSDIIDMMYQINDMSDIKEIFHGN